MALSIEVGTTRKGEPNADVWLSCNGKAKDPRRYKRLHADGTALDPREEFRFRSRRAAQRS
jgi:hypothetical protein